MTLRKRQAITQTYSRLHLSKKPKRMKESEEENDNDIDMITRLPDDVRCHNLSFLSTKHAVSTTILSRSWKNQWILASTKTLDLDDTLLVHPLNITNPIQLYPSLFSNFVNNVLDLIKVSYIQTLRLCCSYTYDPDHINHWLRKTCSYNIIEVDIRLHNSQNPIKVPSSLYGSNFLVILKLKANVSFDFREPISFPKLKVFWIKLHDTKDVDLTRKLFNNHVCRNFLVILKLKANVSFDFREPISFPKLKVFWIKLHDTKDVDLTRKLFNNHVCPILEELFIECETLDANTKVVFLVTLSCLKRLKIEYRLLTHAFHGSVDYSFVLDCPKLESLDLHGNFLAKNSANKGLKVLDYANISVGDPCVDYASFELYGDVNPSNRVFEVLEQLSSVKCLLLSSATTKALSSSYEAAQNVSLDVDDEQEDALLIQLRNFELCFIFLTYLEVGFSTCESWSILPLLLHSSPNLEFLVLRKELELTGFRYKRPSSWRVEGSVPECMLHHLREIEIWGFRGESQELEIIDFFLGYAEVLQKMTMHVEDSSLKRMLTEHVSQVSTASEACQVKVI